MARLSVWVIMLGRLPISLRAPEPEHALQRQPTPPRAHPISHSLLDKPAQLNPSPARISSPTFTWPIAATSQPASQRPLFKMDSLRGLGQTLPSDATEKQLQEAFRSAALSITGLFKAGKKAQSQGELMCRRSSGGQPGPGSQPRGSCEG